MGADRWPGQREQPSEVASAAVGTPGASSIASMPAPRQAEPSIFTPPSVALPKGGGAIRGIGEKFGANPVNGTGSMTIPIFASPGRQDFGPKLALSYDSGAGNGPFGFGWTLDLPNITRKTDKGLPRYHDANESDVFLLSGAEDLVPLATPDEHRHGFLVRRYRPRIEGLFARIERWTASDGDVHWRSITKDNVLSVFGRSEAARITDPSNRRRVYSWLLCESRDDKGNVIAYDYKAEDGALVEPSAHEHHRTGKSFANKYVKSIRYGNVRTALRPDGSRPFDFSEADMLSDSWMFQLVFDYGDHDLDQPGPEPNRQWQVRRDAHSSYRSGFEVRSYRLCRRVLMFHNFPNEVVGGSTLVRSTDLTYEVDPGEPTKDLVGDPRATKLRSACQTGYRQYPGGRWVKRSLPSVDFTYSEARIDDTLRALDDSSMANLPIGVDGTTYQFVDLDGEGVAGVLYQAESAWYYKDGLGPAGFGPHRSVSKLPNVAGVERHQLQDLNGNGHLDLVVLDGPLQGFYERNEEALWDQFRAFDSLPNIAWNDPNLRFVDLTGDGHADILLTEQDAIRWHRSEAELGFGPESRVGGSLDEDAGPRVIFNDGLGSVMLADMSGDGLSDLVRVRNGDVVYWPNLGYGKFGQKVTMDRAPRFDSSDHFDPRRLRIADVDGTGATDLIYLGADGARVYFNESGNSCSDGDVIGSFPTPENFSSVATADLFGSGTACLVWSTPLAAPGALRYVDLMGGQKPHLLTKTVNNLGAETTITYAPSTKFYLADKAAGRPWITRLPFPVHVVERVEVEDRISRNRFTTRYAYHHGYFDGIERECRGFGMVEQFDTEHFATLSGSDEKPASNLAEDAHLPPVHTKTWFHTGNWFTADRVSDYFAGKGDLPGEYFRERTVSHDASGVATIAPDSSVDAAKLLLPDTVIPDGLSAQDQREACRALRGAVLRTEVYALDGSPQESYPYLVTEQNYQVCIVQPRGDQRHGVFFTHPSETLTTHYERTGPVLAANDPTTTVGQHDPRTSHTVVVAVDAFGNVLESATASYGRRSPDQNLPTQFDQAKQRTPHVVYARNGFTQAVDEPGDFRGPLPAEAQTFEITGIGARTDTQRVSAADFLQYWQAPSELAYDEPFARPNRGSNGGQIPAAISGETATPGAPAEPTAWRHRLIEHVRTLYRSDTSPALLPLGSGSARAIPGEALKLAFTRSLLDSTYRRPLDNIVVDDQPADLIDDLAAVLEGTGGGEGGYRSGAKLRAAGLFPADESADTWWLPSGTLRLAPPNVQDPIAHERQHFYLPYDYLDPFGATTTVTYDPYDLLLTSVTDAAGNVVSVGNRTATGVRSGGYDYRVLQPSRLSDANRNRTEVCHDALGMVVATAVRGRPEDSLGDSLDGIDPDGDLTDQIAQPTNRPADALGTATTRVIYDVHAYRRSGQPAATLAISRETHLSDLAPGSDSKVLLGLSYTDGFGREIQKKAIATPGPVESGGPIVTPRWITSGWTVFNNKGKPVRQFEPGFTALHSFEFDRRRGVSPVIFYDPTGRAVVTIAPDRTYAKVTFDPWTQATWDAGDTVDLDPRTDLDTQAIVAKYFLLNEVKGQPWKTWRDERLALHATDPAHRAAQNSSTQAGTPTVVHLDAAGRPFLEVVDNGPDQHGNPARFPTRSILDGEGNQRAIHDAIVGDHPLGRMIMIYDYDMLGNRIHEASMEAGEQWVLNDATGKPIRAWDSRGHSFRHEYDAMRRPLRSFVTGADDSDPARELLESRFVYAEGHPDDERRNRHGKAFLQLDQAGAITAEDFDFKGNPVEATRTVTKHFDGTVDWSAVDPGLGPLTRDLGPLSAMLEDETFTTKTEFDAMNRPTISIAPSGPGMRPSRTRNHYDDSGQLTRVDAQLSVATADPQPGWTAFVERIERNERGQRVEVAHGNGTTTTYTYDANTFRLTSLVTKRDAGSFPGDSPAAAAGKWPGSFVQNLSYTYDPVGNITTIRDLAQQAIFFRNAHVEASSDYRYDAMHRLVEATGREHVGQNPARQSYSWNDRSRTALSHPHDGQAMARYTERYVYDAVGNMIEMAHVVAGHTASSWTRRFAYLEPNQIDATTGSNNRLSWTTVGGQSKEAYAYDPHGNMTHLPHLSSAGPSNMVWSHNDHLAAALLPGNTATWFTYDSSGERVRKVGVNLSGGVADERIYLGSFEIYRKRGAGGLLERETLHITDGEHRVALVETRTGRSAIDQSPQQLSRFQYANHLGSTNVELDTASNLISHEEYGPYGSTTYQAVSALTSSPKRYRYTGKERDHETGLNYHSARYYAPWLCRWTACDPARFIDGPNLYLAMRANPSQFNDPSGFGNFGLKEAGQVFGSAIYGATATLAEGVVGLADHVVDLGGWVVNKADPDLAKDRAESFDASVDAVKEAVSHPRRTVSALESGVRTWQAGVVKSVEDEDYSTAGEQLGRGFMTVYLIADGVNSISIKTTGLNLPPSGGLALSQGGRASALMGVNKIRIPYPSVPPVKLAMEGLAVVKSIRRQAERQVSNKAPGQDPKSREIIRKTKVGLPREKGFYFHQLMEYLINASGHPNIRTEVKVGRRRADAIIITRGLPHPLDFKLNLDLAKLAKVNRSAQFRDIARYLGVARVTPLSYRLPK